ncbi:MAG: HAD family hydrolase [Bacilli bacterium]|nr:HAD family hydrolase [Bacilli bacterium]
MKAIIFDMDGLMFDTESLWVSSAINACKQMEYKITEKLPTLCIGTNKETTKNIFQKHLGNTFDFETFYLISRDIMKEEIKKEGLKTKKGLLELLSYLKDKNYLLAIASSSTKKVINDYLKLTNIDKNNFYKIVSGEDFKESKPNPDIFIKTCELLNVKPNEAIVLEDSNNGITAAYKAGCKTILIPDIDILKDQTIKMATYQVQSLLEVIDILENNIESNK